LVYWQNERGGEKRLFTGVRGHLFAIAPQSGRTIRGFGDNRSIDLGSGLNTPGVIYRDMVIPGGVGGKGSVRAFDVRAGKLRWIFHLIPRPGFGSWVQRLAARAFFSFGRGSVCTTSLATRAHSGGTPFPKSIRDRHLFQTRLAARRGWAHHAPP